MRILITILLILFSFTASAQVPGFVKTPGKYNWVDSAQFSMYKNNLAGDSILSTDTNGKLKLIKKPTGSGAITDTLPLHNQIITKIDTLKRLADSVFGRVNGVWVFQYKDSVGSGSGGSPNTSVGSGIKIAINGTNNIKSLTAGYGAIWDSATTNQVNIKIDTANKIASRLQAQHLIDSLGAVVTTGLAAKENSFTETVERFTGSTSMTVTVAHTPLLSKARIVYLFGVAFDPSNVSITGSAFTISGITRETDDVITVKYSY